jgi:hypothetical protein
MANHAMKRHSMCALTNRHGCDLKASETSRRVASENFNEKWNWTFHKEYN